MLWFLLCFSAFSSTIVGNPINNLHVVTDSGVYKHLVTVIPCEGASWTSDDNDVWISAACEVKVEVCDAQEACWVEVFTAQPEGADTLLLLQDSYLWD